MIKKLPLMPLLIKPSYDENPLQYFDRLDIEYWNNLLRTKSESYWNMKGERMALYMFRLAAERVPAYRKFLKKNVIKASTIKTIHDFKQLPTVNKNNYINKYSLTELCVDGNLSKSHTMSISSGSTGNPTLWPRGSHQELETSVIHELFLNHIFKAMEKKTLVVIAYSMGMYVAGPFTFSSIQRVSSKYDNITVVTPGINITDIASVISNLGKYYDQIILTGYPPFIKDVLDHCEYNDIKLPAGKIKFIFGAESFSEEWREYMCKRVNAKNTLEFSMNTYGSADAAILGHESQLSILVRKIATDNQIVRNRLFGDERIPSIVQYNPVHRFFETLNNSDLVFTTASGIPLIRYEIGDVGGIIPYEKAMSTIRKTDDSLKKQHFYKVSGSCWKLPMVYLFGRKDLTVTLYGLNIYPENIKNALLHKLVSPLVTGKFVFSQEHTKDLNQYIKIIVELKKEKKLNNDIKEKVVSLIIARLRKENLEYNKLYESIGTKAEPVIEFVENGITELFATGVKQKWVR